MKPKRRNLRVCPECGPRIGRRIRARLHDKGKVLIEPRIFTLTVDRKRFATPKDAHQAIANGRYIARLMRTLKVKWWVCVLEFQSESGDGWPHWHLLIDLAEVGGRLDLSKAWKLWRDRWHLGGLDLGERKRGFKSTGHAINYITKYITKYPKAGFPQWVLDAQDRIRFVMSSRSAGRLVAGEGKREASEPQEHGEADEAGESPLDIKTPAKRRKRATESIGKRASQCGTTSVVFAQREVVDCFTGELRLRHQFHAEVIGSPAALALQFPGLVQQMGEDGRYVCCGDLRELQHKALLSDALERDRTRQAEIQAETLCDTTYNRRKAEAGPVVYYAPFLSAEDRELLDCF